ncbi:MAG: hypothetical protein SGPRY_013510 [Prymnesium sp.]
MPSGNAADSPMPDAAPPPPAKRQRKIRLSERVGLNRAPLAPHAAPLASNLAEQAVEAARDGPRPTQAALGSSLSQAPLPTGPAQSNAGREWTVTVALPGSVVDNAQTQELRSCLVGQVARACAIFNVDEIVVFGTETGPRTAAEDPKGRTGGCVFMARLLQYLECPQYLRKQCFPHHPDLRSVGLIPPLDAPHHLRVDEKCAYREAVVVERKDAKAGSCYVYSGLPKELKLNMEAPPGVRLTVRMPTVGGKSVAKAVSPNEPREVAGLYWGYQVRIASGLSAVWSECPHEGGYDCSIGTSEHGSQALSNGSFNLPSFRHLLIVFGGVEGLEPVVSSEDGLSEFDDDVASLFDHYLNICPTQGSRTIRTEEALLVGMGALRPFIENANAR